MHYTAHAHAIRLGSRDSGHAPPHTGVPHARRNPTRKMRKLVSERWPVLQRGATSAWWAGRAPLVYGSSVLGGHHNFSLCSTRTAYRVDLALARG
eukprot:6581091-Prymnesium_polylepis.1